nr:MAG TPA: hypothetical protein [Caudoviricetes sp.]
MRCYTENRHHLSIPSTWAMQFAMRSLSRAPHINASIVPTV